MKKKLDLRIPVAIFIRNEIEDKEYYESKKKTLEDYCMRKGYKVIKVIIETEPTYEFMAASIRTIIEERHHCKYRKLIAFSMNDIAIYNQQLYAIASMLKDNEVTLETMCEGSFEEDILFGITVHENVMNKSEIKQAKKLSFSNSPF